MPIKGCTESRTSVYLDAGAAIGIESIVPVVFILGQDNTPAAMQENDVDPRLQFVAGVLVMTALAVPFIVSAVYGKHATDRCRRYHAGPPYEHED